ARTVMRFGTISRTGISRSRGPRPLVSDRGVSGGGTGLSMRSPHTLAAAADGRTLDRAEFGNDGLATISHLADGNTRLRRRRQQDIETGAEADEPEAFAGIQWLGGLHPADDAARDEAGDLHDADLAVMRLDDHPVALVVFARLVKFGIDELARPILDLRHLSAHGGAVDVAVEDVHENGNAQH